MKCIDCGTRARRRDLRAGRCRKCGRAFAFDPTRDPHPVDDADFHAAVREVSAGFFFTARQLWYALHRERARPPAWAGYEPAYSLAAGAATVALGPLGVVDLGLLPLGLIGLGVAMGVGAFVRALAGSERERRRRPPEVPFDEFRSRLLPRWTEVHGPIERLLPDPAPDAAPREVPADVTAFSFDRAVVTQHAEIAAMLVANRFHFENGCAVLSTDGYPFGIAETIKEMLRRNPRVTVFAIHDASAEGSRFAQTLRDPAWFPDPAILIVDVGLGTGLSWQDLPVLPGTAAKLPAGRGKVAASWSLARSRGSRVELAALRPYELTWMLQRAFGAAGLPGQPTRDETVRRAALTGGIIAATSLPIPSSGDTSSTDGFG